MKLRYMMILIVLPMVGLATYFAMQLVRFDRDIYDVASSARNSALEQTLINDLVHELQKERGFSAGFIASGGASFSTELPQQRKDTDTVKETVLTQIPRAATEHPKLFAAASDALDQLETMRNSVSLRELTVPEMAGFYTKLIADLLEIGVPVPESTGLNKLVALQSTKVYLANAKESAGLERAMGATGLGSSFSDPVRNRFLTLQGAQIALLNRAKATLPEKNWQTDLYDSQAYKDIQIARATISNGLVSSSFEGLTPSDWFKISTAWIELLRDQEKAIGEQLGAIASDLKADAGAKFETTIWAVAIPILLIAAFAIGSFEYMIYRIKKLTSVVDGFARGDFSMFVPSIKGKDELSRMGKAIYVFKQETLAMRKEAEDLKAADEEMLNAKHGEVVELVTHGLAALAKADLTCHFEKPLDPEYDSIRENFNASTDRLRAVLNSIAQTISALDVSSADMKTSAQDLTTRTSDQVDTIRITTQRVGELSSKVDSFGEEIGSASSLAANARKQASTSADLMQDAVGAMDAISSSSEKIGQIITMIDDISFQTNLLSLNAGVEAARAGEAGRGFAVVASEVRQLALRAGEATTEIRELVDESGRSVGSGVDLVKRTGDALSEITQEIAQLDDVLGRIFDGSQSQISELKELSTAIQQIDQLANGNTEMAQATSQSSRQIAERSRELAIAISDFELGNAAKVDQGGVAGGQKTAA